MLSLGKAVSKIKEKEPYQVKNSYNHRRTFNGNFLFEQRNNLRPYFISEKLDDNEDKKTDLSQSDGFLYLSKEIKAFQSELIYLKGFVKDEECFLIAVERRFSS